MLDVPELFLLKISYPSSTNHFVRAMAASPTTFTHHKSHECCPLGSRYRQTGAVRFYLTVCLFASELLRFSAILRDRVSWKAARIRKQLSSLNNTLVKLHPISHLIILAAAFYLSGLVRCASALPTFAVAINFSSTSCTAINHPTP